MEKSHDNDNDNEDVKSIESYKYIKNVSRSHDEVNKLLKSYEKVEKELHPSRKGIEVNLNFNSSNILEDN